MVRTHVNYSRSEVNAPLVDVVDELELNEPFGECGGDMEDLVPLPFISWAHGGQLGGASWMRTLLISCSRLGAWPGRAPL